MKLKDFYQGKKIFITGHTGFKGSWLSEILLCFGANIKGYALPVQKDSLFHILNLKTRMKSAEADIRDLSRLKREVEEFNPEIVLHLAAQPLVIESYHNPVYTYDVNVMGTINILESVRNLSSVKSFINVTTDKVYENKEWEWGYRENENLCGFDPYSNSKSCSELVTYSYKKSFFQKEDSPAISTARSGNVIGGGDFAKNRIIPDCFRDSIEKKSIFVRNPHSVRPYQHVLECLYGYLLLAKLQYESKQFSGNYNFGPNELSCITTGDLVTLFCQYWGGNQGWYTEENEGVHEANFLKLDCSKAKSILNWHPTWNAEEAIEKTVAWTKEYLYNRDTIVAFTDKQIDNFFALK